MNTTLLVALVAPTIFFMAGYFLLARPVKKQKLLWYLWLAFALIASFKTFVFLVVGGSVMAPRFPAWLQLGYGMLQNAYFFALPLALVAWILLWFCRRATERRLVATGTISVIIVMISIVLGVRAGMNAVAAPVLTNYDIFSQKYAGVPDGYRIVQLSDLHMGCNISRSMVEQIVATTNQQHPDLIVITGDLVDGTPADLSEYVAPLKNLKAKDGVFIINGNHEYYSDEKAWEEEWPKYNLTLLNNKSTLLTRDGRPFLALVGLADKQALKSNLPGPDFEKAASYVSKDLPVILLKHRPNGFKEFAPNVSLMLSGHTHGGMVTGLDKLVAFLNGGYVSGLYSQGDARLIVSRGTYLWGGFLARLGVPGEIGVITLHAAHSSLAKAQENKYERTK